jgi:hypothetical protein
MQFVFFISTLPSCSYDQLNPFLSRAFENFGELEKFQIEASLRQQMRSNQTLSYCFALKYLHLLFHQMGLFSSLPH